MKLDTEKIQQRLKNEQQTVDNWDDFSFDHEYTKALDFVELLKWVLSQTKGD